MTTPGDELAVDMAAAAQEIKSDIESGAVPETEIDRSHPNLQETISDDDIPQSWMSGDDEGDVSEDLDPADTDDVDTSGSDGSQTITFKANGQDHEISLEEAQKRLSLAEGGRKAFSEAAKLKKQLKKIREDSKQALEYKEAWDKLEAIKHDPTQLYEAITGTKFDEVIEQELNRRMIYNEATEDERRIMDYEDRVKRLERQQDAERKAREESQTKAERIKFDADKRDMNTQLRQEMLKQLPDDASNRMRKLIWRGALGDVQDYIRQGYKFNDKMVRKVFRDNITEVMGNRDAAVKTEVKRTIETKKQAAKEKAQVASTRNYTDSNFVKKHSGKNPLDLFKAFQRGN